MEQALELGFKFIFEGERIEWLEGLAEVSLLVFGDLGTLQEDGVGGLGWVIGLADAAAATGFLEELEVGSEEVVVEGPGSVEVVDRGDQVAPLDALVAQQLPDVGPVLLLDMGLIVLLVRATARELHGLGALGPETQEVVVEELRT